MDKYAPFVWASYAIALGLLGFLTLFVVLRLKSAKDKHEKLLVEDAE